MPLKLIQIVKELNVGLSTLVEHLAKKGYEVENKPTAKITDQMYSELLKEFQKSGDIKQQAKSLKIRFKVHTNGTFEHQYSNTECGMYSLFFLITMLTNKYEDKMFKSIKQKISFFKRHRIPDKYVEQLRNEYFVP
jgi:hypothetical protein